MSLASGLVRLGSALLLLACSEPRSTPPTASNGSGGATAAGGASPTGGSAAQGGAGGGAVEVDMGTPRPPGSGGANSPGTGGGSIDMATPEAAAPTFWLTVALEGEGRGMVTSTDGAISCSPTCGARFPAGTRVTLRAQAQSPALFTGWKDGCTGTGTCEVVLDRDQGRTAQFRRPGDIIWSIDDLADTRAILLAQDTLFAAGRYSNRTRLAGMDVPDPQDDDLFLAGFDLAGTTKFVRTFGGAASEEFLSLARNSAGVLVGGMSLRQTARFGTITLTPPEDFTSAVVGFSDQGEPTFGRLLPRNAGPWLVTSASGALYTGDLGAVHQLGPMGQPIGSPLFVPAFRQGLAVEASGTITVSGEFSGTAMLGGRTLTAAAGSDAYAGKLRADGSAIWAAAFPGPGGGESSWDVALDSAGDVYVVGHLEQEIRFGSFRLTGKGAEDIFVAKLAGGSGQVIWAKSYGTASEDMGWGVAVIEDRLFIGGTRGPGIDFGTGPLDQTSGGFAAELARADGATLWATGLPARIETFALGPSALYVGGGHTVYALVR